MTTSTTLTFVSDNDRESVVDEITLALGVTFELHESWYLGGDYFLCKESYGKERIYVRRNRETDEIAEPEYPEAPTLVSVESTTRPEEIEHRLGHTSLTLIRRSTWGG